MERVKRQTEAEEPKLKPPQLSKHEAWRRGTLKQKTICRVKGYLSYRFEKVSDPYMLEQRWYLIGAVFVAYMGIYKDWMRAGQFCVYINSRQGSTGTWFKDEDDAHEFIKAELERDAPT